MTSEDVTIFSRLVEWGEDELWYAVRECRNLGGSLAVGEAISVGIVPPWHNPPMREVIDIVAPDPPSNVFTPTRAKP